LLKGIAMKRILFTILFVLFFSGFSLAEVYKWVDDQGVVHFTDDITQVPQKYRPKAEKMGLSEDKEETKVEAESPQKKDERYLDRSGRGEDYWKGRVEEWRRKLREAQVKLEALRVKYNELTERFNDSKSTAERANVRKERDQIKGEMDQSRIQIEEAKEMLEKKIPEEADLYKAKPDWIKP
jgi:flagellar biosynthesis GTPase FlhF